MSAPSSDHLTSAADEFRKTTAGVWTKAFEAVNRRCERACLNRDAYLDRVLAHEAGMLAQETWRNSDRARRYLAHALKKLGKQGDAQDKKLVGLRLHASTIDAINDACVARNVGRDNFINRVFFLLVASPMQLVQALGFDPHDHYESIFDEGNDVKAALLGSSLAAMAQFSEWDPFFGYRIALAESATRRDAGPCAAGNTLLSAYIAPQSLGDGINVTALNCYLRDADTPGSAEHEQEQRRTARELLELGLELEALLS